MADSIVTFNALGWVHFRLRGGWRYTLLTAGLYAVVVVALIALTVHLRVESVSNTLYGWTMGLLGLQAGALVLVSGSGIRNAIRKDLDEGMIESHRLMPISDARAIAGYILGGCAQGLVGAGVGFLLGLATAAGAGLNVFHWCAANAVLVLIAVNFWIAITLLSFVTKSSFAALVFACFVLAFGGGVPLFALPGLMVLISPAMAVAGIVERGTAWGMEYLLPFVAQWVLSVLFFIGAARRYRRNDAPVFGVRLGMILLLTWVLLSIAGLMAWPSLSFPTSFPIGRRMPSLHSYQMAASVLAALFVAMIPVSNAAREHEQWQRRKRLDDPSLPRKPFSPGSAAVLATAIILLISGAEIQENVTVLKTKLIPVGLAVLSSLLSIRYLLGILYRVTTKVGTLLTLWLAATYIGPIVVDMDYTGLAAGSPVTMLLAVCDNWRMPIHAGLVFQCLLTAGMASLYHVSRRPGAHTS